MAKKQTYANSVNKWLLRFDLCHWFRSYSASKFGLNCAIFSGSICATLGQISVPLIEMKLALTLLFLINNNSVANLFDPMDLKQILSWLKQS